MLDAVNYGVPQKRRRIFVVGFKKGGDGFEFPPEQELPFTMQDFLLENASEGSVTSVNKRISVTPTAGDVPDKYFLSDKILCEEHRSYHNILLLMAMGYCNHDPH